MSIIKCMLYYVVISITLSPQIRLLLLYITESQLRGTEWNETNQSRDAGQQIEINRCLVCDLQNSITLTTVLIMPKFSPLLLWILWRVHVGHTWPPHVQNDFFFPSLPSVSLYNVLPLGRDWKTGVQRPLRWKRGLCSSCAAFFQEHHPPIECRTCLAALP